jgi:ATP/ADP translocase/HEAT repeat protein
MPDLSWAGLGGRLGLAPREGKLFLLMGMLVGTLLCAYTLAKVLRDALFLDEFGAGALPYMYVGVALASAFFVWAESKLSARFSRGSATRVTQWLAISLSLAAAASFPIAGRWTTAWFYLWTGSQAMMLMPHFWLLALDLWDSQRARHLFPVLSGFGLIGGLAGGGIAAWLTPHIHRSGLLWLLSALLVVAHGLTLLVQRHRERHEAAPLRAPAGLSAREVIRRSPYIKVLVAALALSVIVSTMVDFQFKYFIKELYQDPQDLTQFLGKFYIGLNVLALLFQFGASGWLLQRLGLGASTGLQPATVMVFATMTALSTGFWAVVAMRWIQGVVFQTLGKSSSEIYFAAIQPRERRLVKPAIDTLVERWSDAAAGVLLIVALRLLHVPIAVIAAMTAVLAATWLVVLLRLNRGYGRAFEEALSTHWIEPETPREAIRTPSARKALLEGLREKDERRIVLALRLAEQAGTRGPIASAIRSCLRHPAPAVRAAALQTMRAVRLKDTDGALPALLADPEDVVRRAAVAYHITTSRQPGRVARAYLEGEDASLRQFALDALWGRPYEIRNAVSLEWIDRLMSSPSRDDHLLAARALGTITGRPAARRLAALLDRDDADIRRTALLSAARRPSAIFLDKILPLLDDRRWSREARHAVAVLGDAAVPRLKALLDPDRPRRTRDAAARTLAEIANPRAVAALMPLVRSTDLEERHLGLRHLARARAVIGRPILTRRLAHRLFLRELRDYRACLDASSGLEAVDTPEVKLLGESYRESAETALERALLGLSAWYEPRPLFGVFRRLATNKPDVAAPALEYLGHALPRSVFRPVMQMFDRRVTPAAAGSPTEPERIAAWIRSAWESGDDWLRACAFRAARHLPGFDLRNYPSSPTDGPITSAERKVLPAELKVFPVTDPGRGASC